MLLCPQTTVPAPPAAPAPAEEHDAAEKSCSPQTSQVISRGTRGQTSKVPVHLIFKVTKAMGSCC